MKIAILKIGSRIAHTGTSAGSGSTLSIMRMLYLAGADVHAYTKVLSKDLPIEGVTKHDIHEEYDAINDKGFDCLMVVNGNVNFFGGAESRSEILNYHILNNFKGRVFYVYSDPSLVLRQLWPSVSKKDWGSKYDMSDIHISRKDIIYISQPRNVIKIMTDIKKADIEINNMIQYPLEKYPMVVAHREETIPLSERKYDLLYGGTFRGGKRQVDMIEFYFGQDDMRVEMFGNIKEKHFSPKLVDDKSYPTFGKAVQFVDFSKHMSESVATVIIGDKYYKEVEALAQRTYECILARNVVFIDSSYDINKKTFSKETLVDFNYVSSGAEVHEKLQRLKSDEQFFKKILKLQMIDAMSGMENYCSDFYNRIKLINNRTGE